MFVGSESGGDGWITRRVKWGNSVVEFGGGELWEQGILKEGLGERNGADSNETSHGYSSTSCAVRVTNNRT